MSKLIEAQVWERAAELVQQGFTTKAMARNSNGKTVSVYAKTATQFCAAGAIMRAARAVLGKTPAELRFLERACRKDWLPVVVEFNECGYKQLVMTRLKREARRCSVTAPITAREVIASLRRGRRFAH